MKNIKPQGKGKRRNKRTRGAEDNDKMARNGSGIGIIIVILLLISLVIVHNSSSQPVVSVLVKFNNSNYNLPWNITLINKTVVYSQYSNFSRNPPSINKGNVNLTIKIISGNNTVVFKKYYYINRTNYTINTYQLKIPNYTVDVSISNCTINYYRSCNYQQSITIPR